VGPVESRVNGVGPQVGVIFPAGSAQGFLGLKGYAESDSTRGLECLGDAFLLVGRDSVIVSQIATDHHKDAHALMAQPNQ
jgi:hypothetical protein